MNSERVTLRFEPAAMAHPNRWAGKIVNASNERIALQRIEATLWQRVPKAKRVRGQGDLIVTDEKIRFLFSTAAELWPGNVHHFEVDLGQPRAGVVTVSLDNERVFGQVPDVIDCAFDDEDPPAEGVDNDPAVDRAVGATLDQSEATPPEPPLLAPSGASGS